MDDLGDDVLRKDPKFLKNVNDWDGGGATISKNTSGNIDLSDAAGNKIGEIKNGNILPEKYGSNGTPIGEPKNGYQLVNDGGELKLKRTPDLSGYDACSVSKCHI